MIHHLVHLGISPGEKAFRTVAVYLALLVLLHLSGKRSLAQLNSFDLVVLLLLSNVVQNAIIGNDNSLTGGLMGAVILLGVNVVLVRAAFMSPRFGKALQGGPTTTSFASSPSPTRSSSRAFAGKASSWRTPSSSLSSPKASSTHSRSRSRRSRT